MLSIQVCRRRTFEHVGLIRFRTDFFRVIRVSVTGTSLPWAGRVSRRQRSRRSSECFLPYNSRPPQRTPILDSLRLRDSRDAHRFASHDHGHVFLGTTARESEMSAFVCIFSCIGFSLAHPCCFRLRLVHTSDKVQGQIYIPIANWIREYPFHSNWTILKLVSSYDSNHCYSRCFQKLHSAHQCLRFCGGHSHVYHKRAYLASNTLYQAPSLDRRDFVFEFLRIPGW